MIVLDSSVESKTAPPLTTRLRKVYYGHYDSEFGSPHPVIRLGGKYLEALGFHIGDAIEVHLQHGCITIRRVFHPEEQKPTQGQQSTSTNTKGG